ncbi:hypothetical protein ABS642_00810 [Microbacterium sp. A8/3-1]|uniref:Uncharacterized protein n=1 Tax=Microbacterium sp. A8/3-1 TaxID=3160749 RepID=A0AAU7VYR1_9MICO
MILPPNYRAEMTFDEARDGYLEDGLPRDDAEVYARVLTSPPIENLPII